MPLNLYREWNAEGDRLGLGGEHGAAAHLGQTGAERRVADGGGEDGHGGHMAGALRLEAERDRLTRGLAVEVGEAPPDLRLVPGERGRERLAAGGRARGGVAVVRLPGSRPGAGECWRRR